jgi:hypothetical protein
MSEPTYKAYWPEFIKQMEKRLQTGHEQYGDGVFDRPLPVTLEEIEQEFADVIGWGFIGWVKVQRIKEALVESGSI